MKRRRRIATPGIPVSNVRAKNCLTNQETPARANRDRRCQSATHQCSAAQWEVFINEWVHFASRKRTRIFSSLPALGTRVGIDIAGFADAKKLEGIWDNYQCKHYDHALYPSDAWPGIGKVLWYSFQKYYAAPRKYFFVAPFGFGTTPVGYLSNASKLKNAPIGVARSTGSTVTSPEALDRTCPFLPEALGLTCGYSPGT